MAEAKERAAWWRASFVVAHLLSPWCKDGKGPSPRDLHPMERGETEIPGSITDLKILLEGV